MQSPQSVADAYSDSASLSAHTVASYGSAGHNGRASRPPPSPHGSSSHSTHHTPVSVDAFAPIADAAERDNGGERSLDGSDSLLTALPSNLDPTPRRARAGSASVSSAPALSCGPIPVDMTSFASRSLPATQSLHSGSGGGNHVRPASIGSEPVCVTQTAGAHPPPRPPPAPPQAPPVNRTQVGWRDSGSAEHSFVSFPQNADSELCKFFAQTGFCRFGASCFKHHPDSFRVPRNQNGYPMRMGEPECSFYMQTAACKFGPACKFHHPNLEPVYAGGDLQNGAYGHGPQ